MEEEEEEKKEEVEKKEEEEKEEEEEEEGHDGTSSRVVCAPAAGPDAPRPPDRPPLEVSAGRRGCQSTKRGQGRL